MNLYQQYSSILSAFSSADIFFLISAALFTVFIAIWIVCQVLAFLNALFGNRLMAESEATDQGAQLNNSLETIAQNLSSIASTHVQTLQTQVNTVINKEVNDISSVLRQSQKQLKDVFISKSSLHDISCVLTQQEAQLGQVYGRSGRRVSMSSVLTDVEKSASGSLCQVINESVGNAESEYTLLIRDENLQFESEDSISVRVAKLFRRCIRWAERRSRWFLQPVHFGEKIKKVKVRTVAFQKILENRLGSEFQNPCQKHYREIRQLSSKLRSLISEASRVTRFNLEAALAELEERGNIQTAQETALGGLDRALARIESILPEKEDTIKQFSETLAKSSQTAMNRIRRDADFADTVGEMWTRFNDQMKKRFSSQVEPTRQRWRSATLRTQRIWKLGKQKLTRAKTSLGLESQSANELVGLLDHATVQHAQNKVPTLYRRVFRFEPLSDDEFFVGRGQELGKIEAAYKRWKDGYPSSVAIHGPSGSGKTSLLQCSIHRYFHEQKMFQKTLEQTLSSQRDLLAFLKGLLKLEELNGSTGDIRSLAETAKSQLGKAVVIVEGLQHLFQRRIGGFQILQDFLQFMIMTRSHFLWVVCSSELGWDYLNYTKNLSKYFVYHIPSQNMSRKSIEKVIMVRHEITGYSLNFDSEKNIPRDLMWKIKRLKDPKEVQTLLRNAFFDELHQITGGNIFSALYHWLTSIEFEDGERIRVTYPVAIRHDSIRTLTTSQMAALHAVLQHGSLDANLHSQIFRSHTLKGEGVLAELERKNILHQKTGGQYLPNPIVVPVIMKVLKERNLVYE